MTATLVAERLHTFYGKSHILHGVSLEAAEGQVTALLGRNGAGKTTTIRMVCGLLHRDAGTVHVDELEVNERALAAKARIGYVPQDVALYPDLTARENLEFIGRLYRLRKKLLRERVDEVLALVDLSDRGDDRVDAYSGGMKRRLMIARALVHEPRLLILDEPTAGVDIEIRRTMWDFLRETNERGVTIILTTHYLEEAENLCRHVAIIDKGRIIENDRMPNVLRKLQTETFVLNLREPAREAPNLPGFGVVLVDDRTLEVEVSKDKSLNDIFVRLAAQGIDVVSMRNKVNRLEELFMRLVSGASDGAAPPLVAGPGR